MKHGGKARNTTGSAHGAAASRPHKKQGESSFLRDLGQSTSIWNCFLKSNGAYVDTIEINWGHSTGAAEWACSEWRSECGDNGGCYVTGGCDLRTRMDGCSLDWSDPWTQYGRDHFGDACNKHDACYHGLSDDFWDGFNTCNDRFWDDMGSVCNSVPWYENWHCHTVRSAWGTAMNADPGRTKFSDSYASDRTWAEANCYRG